MFKSPTAAKLQEIGPRFTLKLRWLRKGLPAVGAADGVAPGQAAEEDAASDDEADEGDDQLNDQEMDDGMEVDRQGDSEDEEAKPKKKDEGKAKGGRRIPALDEQQEYEWKWKVRERQSEKIGSDADDSVRLGYSPRWRFRGGRSSCRRSSCAVVH